MRPKRKKSSPYHLCGQCCNGLRVSVRNGVTVAVRCGCWKYRRSTPPATEFKQQAAGR